MSKLSVVTRELKNNKNLVLDHMKQVHNFVIAGDGRVSARVAG